LALLINIRLGWKSLAGTNTPAYYENPEIMALQSFIGLAPSYHSKIVAPCNNSDQKAFIRKPFYPLFSS
jgi:hypothetical protein